MIQDWCVKFCALVDKTKVEIFTIYKVFENTQYLGGNFCS